MLKDTRHPVSSGDDATPAIDHQRVGARSIALLLLATLVMVADGYDLAVMGFVVPQLTKTWHITPADLVPALSAGVIGLLVGAPLFGFVGDRYGRRIAILACLAIVGVFSLVNMAVTNLGELIVLRFLIGVGIGGLSPTVFALAAEAAPPRRRGLFVIIVNFGVPIGIALPGWTTAWLVPQYGWPALLLVGGLLPLVMAAFAVFFLHESASFLRQREDPAPPPGTRSAKRASASRLFAGGFALITPAFWVLLAANQFANFFTLSWLPTLLQSSGLSTAEAGVSASMFSLGGVVGGLVLTVIIDRFGSLPLVALFLLGSPLIAFMGMSHLSPMLLMATIASAGFCVTGNNFGANAVMGAVYPTAIRSRGIGWAQAFGRLGSLAAQIVGGLVQTWGWPIQEIYLAPALVLLVGASAAVVLASLCYRRFGTFRLDDAAPGSGWCSDRLLRQQTTEKEV